jgi:hypothetical protein
VDLRAGLDDLEKEKFLTLPGLEHLLFIAATYFGHTRVIIRQKLLHGESTGLYTVHLNTLERYHTYKISKNNLHMIVTHIEAYHPIFQTVHELYDR